MDTKFQRRKIGLSFYELPVSIRSSAEIINEARAEMASQRNGFVAMAPGGIRAVDTKRPFTPRDSQRTLFGKAVRPGVNRPPSAVSLRYLQNEKICGEANNPKQWLVPNAILLPHRRKEIPGKSDEVLKPCIPNIWHSVNNSNRVKLPTLPQPIDLNLKSSRAIRLQFHPASLKNLPEEDEEKIEHVENCQKLNKACSIERCNNKTCHSKLNSNDPKSDKLKKNVDCINFEKNSVISKVDEKYSASLDPSKTDVEGCSRNLVLVNDDSHHTPVLNHFKYKLSYSNESTTKEMERSCSSFGENSLNQEPDINAQLIQITQTLHSEAGNENNESKIISIIYRLYELLEANDLLSYKLSSKTKTQILRSLYKFVERSDNELLLEVAHVVLALCVTGNNLAGVCKLIFKVSRNEKNDNLFLKGNLLELFVNALGTAEPMEDAETCIYGYGAIKFLTMNSSLLKKLLNFGILELMVLHMKVINKWRIDEGQISEQTSHALFQLTGALRNVAGEEEDPFPNAFVSSGVIKELCCTIQIFSCDLDIISNVSRTLSILSTHDVCCSAIIEHENSLRTIIKLLKKYPGRQDIVVRLNYVLGNLMAKSDKARLEFYSEEEALTCLINLLYKYIDIGKSISSNPEHNFKPKKPYSASNEPAEDVLVKIVRIIANISISPVVGLSIVEMNQDQNISNNVCVQIVDALLSILKNHQVTRSPELVLSSLATLNNLSFWAVGTMKGDFYRRKLEIAEALYPFLMEEHTESLLEAVRVFGNLTQLQDVRDYTVESGMLERLILLLKGPLDISMDLLLANVGVLVNMMADIDKRRILANHNGISRLIEILEKCNGNNWNLSSLICQVIWNYLIESKDLYYDLGTDATEKLVSILADYLDEEHYFGVPEGSAMDPAISFTYNYQQWEEFAAVATDLLEKIEAFMDSYPNLSMMKEISSYKNLV